MYHNVCNYKHAVHQLFYKIMLTLLRTVSYSL